MERKSLEKSSLELSEILDHLGYSYSMVKYRQEINRHMDSLFNKNKLFSHMEITTTGSKGGGTAKYFESDIDRLCILDGIVCVNSGANISIGAVGKKDRDILMIESIMQEDMTVFELLVEGCSPGYARLRLRQLKPGYFRKLLEFSLVTTNEGIFIENNFPKLVVRQGMVDINAKSIYPKNKKGPSLRYCNSQISYDFVNGFEYKNRQMLYQWAESHKSHHWPPLSLVEQVCQTKGQLVPVANKNSLYQNTEWRICFTEAELLLVRSFNECQIKVFIFLKLTSKHSLKPICQEISSYTMKNIIMWIAERYPADEFKVNCLFPRFLDALKFLKECIRLGELKSYLIPDRNLFQDRISVRQQRKLIRKIEQMISQGAYLFNDIGPLGTFLNFRNLDREKAKKKGVLRDEVEILLLKKNVEFKKIEQEWFRQNFKIDFKTLANDHKGYYEFDQQIMALLKSESDLNDAEMVFDFKKILKNVLS